MVEHVHRVLNTCYTIKTKELIAIITLVLLLTGAYNKVMAQIDQRYATKEYVQTINTRIERVDGNLQRLLDHFSIKGIESK